jgi:signal transduction histidine kinase
MGHERSVVLSAFLLLGCAAAALVWTGAFSMAHETSELVVLAHRADRSTYLVGEVAHRIDDISATLDEQPGENSIVSARARVLRDLERLDDAMRELPRFLDEDDASTFAQVEPRIPAFRAAVSEVLARSGNRYTTESRAVFQQNLLPLVAELEAPLDHLIDLNERQSNHLLDQLEHQLVGFRRSYLILGGTFVLFLVAVGVGTLRLIRQQHLAIQRRMVEIEEINRDLDAFAGRVAHDLRGPLTPIILSAARLRQGIGRPEVIEQAASRIITAAERANTLIESLLAFSRAGSDARSNLEGPSLASDVVERALEGVGDAAQSARVELSKDVAPIWASIDASLLEEVLDNLLVNAIRHMGARTTRRVAVRVRSSRGVARFEVADTGPGVPVEARSRIFQPFFRLDPRMRDGVGVGLATVKRIVESRGGEIGVQDALGGGALFWFTIPVHAPTEQASYRGDAGHRA